VRAAIEKICARFGDDYWLKRDSDGNFPEEFYRALADDGWLGVCIPQAYGGSGLGVSEAAVMMQAVAASGAGLSGASAIHMNIFGLNPVAVYGTEDQKRRMLPPIAAGKEKACFAVTEPDAGLETAKIKTRAERRGRLHNHRRQDLDFDGAGRRQDAAARPHRATRRRPQADRRA
jgi:acyl-CoA dehydrogenase